MFTWKARMLKNCTDLDCGSDCGLDCGLIVVYIACSAVAGFAANMCSVKLSPWRGGCGLSFTRGLAQLVCLHKRRPDFWRPAGWHRVLARFYCLWNCAATARWKRPIFHQRVGTTCLPSWKRCRPLEARQLAVAFCSVSNFQRSPAPAENPQRRRVTVAAGLRGQVAVQGQPVGTCALNTWSTPRRGAPMRRN